MKIVTLQGSPHGTHGATGRLLAEVVEPIRAAGAKTAAFDVADMKVEPCRGCGACHKLGKCVIQDDFADIKNALVDADGVIFASPNYIFSVSAQLKAVIDRCSCFIHCQMMEDRYGAAVVTSGGSGGEEVSEYLKRVLRALGCWTVGSVECEGWALSNDAARRPVFERAAALGAAMVGAMRDKRTFPEQLRERQSFFERMKDLVTRNKEEWPFEYEYWESHGRL